MMRNPRQVMSAAKKPIRAHKGNCAAAGNCEEASNASAAPSAHPKVSARHDQEVLVDVNFKSEGVIPRAEFKDTDTLEVGSEIEVYIEKLEDELFQLKVHIKNRKTDESVLIDELYHKDEIFGANSSDIAKIVAKL